MVRTINIDLNNENFSVGFQQLMEEKQAFFKFPDTQISSFSHATMVLCVQINTRFQWTVDIQVTTLK